MRFFLSPDFSIRIFAFSLWIAFSGVSALAQGTEPTFGINDFGGDEPISITSENLVLDQEDGAAVFSGDVIIRQGSVVLMSGMVRVEYDVDPTTQKSRITSIHMLENVTFTNGDETAEADRAVYSVADSLLVMSGNVLIIQGVTAISADTLEYNFTSGERRAGGNVRTTLRLNEN
ncbi:MAG: LptA/OstA family protein [Rhodobacter sp.]|nr:LptA/OstA family protein [Rhodobacter sp.]MCY4242274.1 LptA/OstA family protein [Rhodobacter sp.]